MEDCYLVRAGSNHRHNQVKLVSYFQFTRFIGLYEVRDELKVNKIKRWKQRGREAERTSGEYVS